MPSIVRSHPAPHRPGIFRTPVVLAVCALLATGGACPGQTDQPPAEAELAIPETDAANTMAGASRDISLERIGGLPVARCVIRRGTNEIQAYLMFDISMPVPLRIHEMSLSGLGLRAKTDEVQKVDIVFGNRLELRGIPVESKRYPLLEAHTQRYAPELGETPIVGYFGPGAFSSNVVELDLAKGLLRGMGMEPGNARESELSYVPLDFGFVVKGTGPADVEVAAVVSTTLHESALVPSVLKTAREKGVKPNVLEIGKVPWGERAAIRFEPLDKTWPAFVNGVIGAEALAHATVTLWPERHRIAFRPASTSSFSQSEQDYFFALADRDPAGIARFIESRPRQRLMDEAVLKHLWIRFNNLNSTEAELTGALDIIASNHSEARRSATLLDIADLVEESMHPLREPVVGHALDLATRESVRALEQTAAHEVHLRLGRRALAKGRIDQARSHLLSAAFGKPKDATCNYWLGELYRETGKPRRAWSRYFQALLDEKLASDDPLRAKALQRLDEINGDAEFRKTFDIPEAEQYMDGRLAAAEFHPETRYRFVRNEHPHHARVVELFVNSNGPLGGGLELACQALDEFFEGEVVFISWHLDDPMHTAASRERLAFYQKTSPPLVVIDGEPKFDTPLGRGIIPAEDAAEHYPLVRDACLPETAPETSTWNIDGRIGGNDSRVNVGVTVNGADSPDGLRLVVLLCEQSVMAVQNNGVFFHHFVARDSLTPPAGVDLAEAMRKPLEMEIDIANLRKRLATGRPQADASSGAGAASFVDPRQLFAVALVQRVSDSRVLSARKIVLPESR